MEENPTESSQILQKHDCLRINCSSAFGNVTLPVSYPMYFEANTFTFLSSQNSLPWNGSKCYSGSDSSGYNGPSTTSLFGSGGGEFNYDITCGNVIDSFATYRFNKHPANGPVHSAQNCTQAKVIAAGGEIPLECCEGVPMESIILMKGVCYQGGIHVNVSTFWEAIEIGSVEGGLQVPGSCDYGAVKAQHDPHMHFAHGGEADFRGRNGRYYAMLSAPNIQFAARTMDTDFMLPIPLQFVHGSFFTSVAWTVRGRSGREYGITVDADSDTFYVIDTKDNSTVATRQGVWQQWWEDGIRAYNKQSTIYVRANGWEVNASRNPVYNHVSGPSKWRFDVAMRPLDGRTGFESKHGKSSDTCFPHGVLAQSWDGDDIAVFGAEDDYTITDETHPVFTTKAMAEGAIEGTAADYELAGPHTTHFAYSRYKLATDATCAPRDVHKLTGSKYKRHEAAAIVAASTLL